MVVVTGGKVRILKPAGPVKVLPSEPNEEGQPHTPKAMPVEVVACRFCKEVPPVLAGIAANKFYARGTFRLIEREWGNHKAIDWVAGNVHSDDYWNRSENGPDQLLECLGSTEMETLVAKVFEAHGCFVPAYRGGVMKDIDLFAHNDSAHPIAIGPITVPAKGNISIQVKRWADGMKCPTGVDWLVGLGVKGPRTIDGAKLLRLVLEAPSVRQWLERSLHWLPRDILDRIKTAGLQGPA